MEQGELGSEVMGRGKCKDGVRRLVAALAAGEIVRTNVGLRVLVAGVKKARLIVEISVWPDSELVEVRVKGKGVGK